MKISTAQEAINGNSNDTVITPLRLKQVLKSKNISEGGSSGGITTETDPIFKASPAGSITTSDVAKWNAKQEALVSGTNIKTINGQDILGEGDIVIEGGSSGESEFIEGSEKNIIMAFLSQSYNLTADAWTDVVVNLSDAVKSGEDLTLVDGSVVIGKNIKLVQINGSIRLTAAYPTGYYYIKIFIYKPDGTQVKTVQQYYYKANTNYDLSMEINDFLVPVDEGYKVTMKTGGSVAISDKSIISHSTFMTVDAVNSQKIPIASRQILGAIKVGSNLTITSDGVLNAPPAVINGDGLDTVPVDSIFEYEGDVAPEGYEDIGYNQSLLDKMHPVGSLYMSLDATDPGTLFGGVWERLKGVFPFLADDTDEVGTVDGEREVSLTEAQNGPHSHRLIRSKWYGGDGNGTLSDTHNSSTGSVYGYTGGTTARFISRITNGLDIVSSGSGEPHNNMPPHMVFYGWIRVE